MKSQFELLKTTRRHFVNYLKYYDLKTLNKIPSGFSNSIFWNAAHVLVTQQLLHYYLSDNVPLIEEDWIKNYKKGTVPDENVSQDDLENLIELLEKTSVQLIKDYENEKFAFYKSYETSYGVFLTDIDSAIHFNNIHESLHLGYVMAMRKVFV